MAEGFITRRGGKGGVDVSDATAVQSDVLQGKTFYAGDETIKTGTIPSKGAETFTPSTSNQTIAAGQFLSGTQTILGDADLIPENIREGTTIFNVTGTLTPPPPPQFFLSFDGVDDEVNLGNVFSDNNSYTLYGKFLFDTLHNGVIYSFGGSSDTRIRIQNTGVLNYAPFNNTVNNYLFSPVLSTNTIHEFVVIRDKSNGMSLYVNGVLVDSNNATGNALSRSDQDAIGRHLTAADRFNGNIYDIKLYNTVITNQQAIDLSSGLSITTTPFAHWDFSDGSGTTLTDIVGNNNGTIVGATWEQE